MQSAIQFPTSLTFGQQIQLTKQLFGHHLLIVGQTGSGKTTTTLALLSQLQQQNETAIILDPTGEYTQLPNTVTYRFGDNAYFEAGKLSAAHLLRTLQLPVVSTLLQKLRQAITDLRLQQNVIKRPGIYQRLNRPIHDHQQSLRQLGSWASDYHLPDLFDQLIAEFVVPRLDEEADYHLLGQQYDRVAINRQWPQLTMLQERLASPVFLTLFDTDSHPGTMKSELNFVLKMFLHHASQHRTLVIDLSLLKNYEDSQRLLISLLLKQILKYRLQSNAGFPVNVVLDEAHRYLPKDGHDLADNGIFQLLREGRKLDLKMILTTQSPLDLPARLRSQFGDLIVHRLLDENEVHSLPGNWRLPGVAGLATGEINLCFFGHQAVKGYVNLPTWWREEVK